MPFPASPPGVPPDQVTFCLAGCEAGKPRHQLPALIPAPPSPPPAPLLIHTAAGIAPGTAACSWAHQHSTPPTRLPFPSIITFHLSCYGYGTIRIPLLVLFSGREPEWPLDESQSEREDLYDTDSNLPHCHSATVEQLFPC